MYTEGGEAVYWEACVLILNSGRRSQRDDTLQLCHLDKISAQLNKKNHRAMFLSRGWRSTHPNYRLEELLEGDDMRVDC